MPRIDPEIIKGAAQVRGVLVNDQEAAELSSTVALAEQMHAQNFAHGSLDDVLGPGGRARFEDALPLARIALEAAIYVARSFDEEPRYIGDIDPMATVAFEGLAGGLDDRTAKSIVVADAARKLHKSVLKALADLTEEERNLLKEVRPQKRAPGRPEKGLSLARRIIIAVYHVWHHSGRSTSVPGGRSRRTGSTSELIKICEAILELTDLVIDRSTIINTINTYRAEVLLQSDPNMAFSKIHIDPVLTDFLGFEVRWKSGSTK